MAKQMSRRTIMALGPAAAAGNTAAGSDDPLRTVESRLAARGRFMMPAHFGPLPSAAPGEYKASGPGDAPYGDVQGISVTYLTDGKMLSQFLPTPYELSGEPLVNVSYAMTGRSTGWRAGRITLSASMFRRFIKARSR